MKNRRGAFADWASGDASLFNVSLRRPESTDQENLGGAARHENRKLHRFAALRT